MIDAIENEPCSACSGLGYYRGKHCGACCGTGLQYSKDELITKLKNIINQLQNTSSNSDYTAQPSASPKLPSWNEVYAN